MRHADSRSPVLRADAPADARTRQMAAFGRAPSRRELDDDISHLFGPGPGIGEGVPLRSIASVKGVRFTNPPHVIELAAQLEAERKAEAKAMAAEGRALRTAERRAAKDAEFAAAIARGDVPAKAVRRPRKAAEPKAAGTGVPVIRAAPAAVPVARPTGLRVLEGRSIPATVIGTIAIMGGFKASTGDAIVVDVTGENNVARGIVVWAGHAQTVVRGLVATGTRARMEVRQPANDRFKPSAGSVKAA